MQNEQQTAPRLRKAQRQKAKIRLGLAAVSGGGKTYGAILIAKGLTGGDMTKIAIIDTENNSADLYQHMGDYNVLPLEQPYNPERYIDAIQECESAGMEVIIIDSIAHEWEGTGGVLQLCDSIGGGFQTAWKQMTPRHDAFKNAILTSKCHVITTVRRKQEYILTEALNSKGNTVQKPVKAGMKEITREGWEYELTVNLELDINHATTASKDRTGLFTGKDPFIITEKTGALIREWCETGADIQGEINIACNKLSGCNTIIELTTLKESLPPYVRDSDQFKKAGGIRYKELNPAPASAIQPANNIPPNNPPVQQTLILPIVDTTLQQIEAATTVDQLTAMYVSNPDLFEKNPANKQALSSKKLAILNAGKVILDNTQFRLLCNQVYTDVPGAYDSAIKNYILNAGQLEELQHLEKERIQFDEALKLKYNNAPDIVTMINNCRTPAQVVRLHSNNALIIEREAELMTKVNAKLASLKKIGS